MKKYLSVLSVLALAACGGGSGSGISDSEVVRPSVTPRENAIRTSNLVISSNIDNESKRSAHVVNTLGEDYYSVVSNGVVTSARSARPPVSNDKEYCSNPRECNDVAFNNMKKWLIDNINSFDSWEWNSGNAELRNALILAGFKNKLSGNWDNIKAWFRDNFANIKAQAEDIYSDIGIHQDFDITKSDLMAVSHMDGDAKIKFVFGDHKEITGMEYVVTHAPGVVSTLPAERISNQDAKFKMNTKVYMYTLGGIGVKYDPASADDGGRSITLMSDKALTLSEIKTRLNRLIAHYKEQGGFFDTFHNWPTENGEYEGDKQTAIINALYAEVQQQINDLDNIAALHPEVENIDTEIDFQSAGKQLGLAYSDFGIIRVAGEDEIFHGGYPDNKIELATVRDLHKNMVFKGTAVGIVEKSTETGDNRQTTGKLDLTGNAQLVVANTGKETLTANFDKWYDVTVERNTDNSDKITFNNYKNADSSYKFKHVDSTDKLVARADGYSVANFTRTQTPHTSDFDAEVTGKTEGNLVIDYFGPSGSNNPTEFSGTAMYHENVPYNQNEAGHYDNVDGVRFMMGFGGKKQY